MQDTSIAQLFPNSSHNAMNESAINVEEEKLNADDASWALGSAFIILTMQTGFAMLECGCVSAKNTVNIMVKNCIDVSIGGLSYWMFGYALSFGNPSNFFCGYGDFFFTVDAQTRPIGSSYSKYFFQFSFATTATTITSGAVAERMTLRSYTAFSFLNVLVYSFPSSWVWNTGDSVNSFGGFLYQLKYFDFAGVSVVHLTGGVSALVAAIMLGPRSGRWTQPESFAMSSPITSLAGMFMLWWAWLGFNCGSTFGVSGDLWKVSALVAVTTMNGAIGGGISGLILSFIAKRGKVDIEYLINSILGGLVAITGCSAVITPGEALLIGAVGGLIASAGIYVEEKLRIDDPVGAVSVHMFAAIWGTICTGIFGQNNFVNQLRGFDGLIHGGGFYLLGIQALGCVCIMAWSGVTSFILLWLIDKSIGLRMSPEEEVLGADWVEHSIHSEKISQKLEATLHAISEDKWNNFMLTLHRKISGVRTFEVDARHRVYAPEVENGGAFTVPKFPIPKFPIVDFPAVLGVLEGGSEAEINENLENARKCGFVQKRCRVNAQEVKCTDEDLF